MKKLLNLLFRRDRLYALPWVYGYFFIIIMIAVAFWWITVPLAGLGYITAKGLRDAEHNKRNRPTKWLKCTYDKYASTVILNQVVYIEIPGNMVFDKPGVSEEQQLYDYVYDRMCEHHINAHIKKMEPHRTPAWDDPVIEL